MQQSCASRKFLGGGGREGAQGEGASTAAWAHVRGRVGGGRAGGRGGGKGAKGRGDGAGGEEVAYTNDGWYVSVGVGRRAERGGGGGGRRAGGRRPASNTPLEGLTAEPLCGAGDGAAPCQPFAMAYCHAVQQLCSACPPIHAHALCAHACACRCLRMTAYVQVHVAIPCGTSWRRRERCRAGRRRARAR